jgi:hypothetical protein
MTPYYSGYKLGKKRTASTEKYACKHKKNSVQEVQFSSIRTIPSALEFHQFSQDAIFDVLSRGLYRRLGFAHQRNALPYPENR